MTTYNDAAVSDASIAFQKPITLQQGRALRNNPIATAEGATDAPYVAAGWHPYDGVTVGDGADGVIYDFAVDGALGTIVSPNFVDGYEYQFIFNGLSLSLAVDLTVEWYMESSAAYSASYLLQSWPAGSYFLWGTITSVRPRITAKAFSFVGEGVFNTALSNVSGVGLSGIPSGFVVRTLAQKVLNARFDVSGSGTFDAGTIQMMKRRCYA